MRLATKMNSIIAWLRNQEKQHCEDHYFWTNLDKKADDNELAMLRRWLDKHLHQKGFAIILNGICPLRPQRTFGGIPEWVRGVEAPREFPNDSCFIFVSQFTDGREESLFKDVKDKAYKTGAELYVIKGAQR